MSKTVFVINGAPNSGKDTIAKAMKETMQCGAVHNFKDALYDLTAKMFGRDYDEFVASATGRVSKEAKDKRLTKCEGMPWYLSLYFIFMALIGMPQISPRDALIYVSEKIIKPKYGKTFFGKQLAQKILKSDEEFFYIPDSGFIEELGVLVSAGLDIVFVRVHRDGCDFSNDSRTLLTDEMLEQFNIKGIDIDNNGSLEDLKANVLNLMVKSIHGGGTKDVESVTEVA